MNLICIIPNTQKKLWKESVVKLTHKIIQCNKQVLLDSKLRPMLGEIKGVVYRETYDLLKYCDMIISLGGDGTLINAAKFAAPNSIPVLGINIGNLGYLVELDINEFDWLDKILAGQFTYDNRAMLDIEVIRNNKSAAKFLALNETLVSKGEISRLIELEFYADNKFISSYRADGLIIATPTGSTAYSLSAGGPIIEPQTSSVVITPVCPHSLVSIPIVMSIHSCFEIKITEKGDKDIYVTADGDKHFRLFEHDIVRVKKSNCILRLIRVKEQNFYAILRQKLEERI